MSGPAILTRIGAAAEPLHDKLKSLVRVRTFARRHEGRIHGTDHAVSLIYFGNGSNLHFLLRVVFGGPCESRPLGNRTIWTGTAFSRRNAAAADLVAFDVPWPWEIDFGDRFVIEVPAWLRQGVDLPPEREAFYRGLHRSVRGEQMRKIRKNGLTGRTTSDEDEIRRFYRTMYLPYVCGRFGPEAATVPEPRFVKVGVRGLLLQVLRGGRVVAGSVLRTERGTVESLWTGFDRSDPRALDGATAALFHFLVEYAFANGFRTVDYCGSRPLLTDGVFETKRRWGGTVFDDWSLETLLLQINRFTPGVASVLSRCPWITRQDGGLVGKVLLGASADADADALGRDVLRLASPGLDGLHVYLPRGAGAGVPPPVDSGGVPVTVFELGRGADALETYCNR